MIKYLSVTIFLIVAAVSNVSALGSCFWITNPYSVTSWTAGSSVNITWELPACGTSYTAIDVYLMAGETEDATQLATIATNLPLHTTFVGWNIPSSLPAGDGYFINVEGTGGSEIVERYSHTFEILSSASSTTTTTSTASSTTSSRTRTASTTTGNSATKVSNSLIVPLSVFGLVVVSMML